jgi:hypothetical protein
LCCVVLCCAVVVVNCAQAPTVAPSLVSSFALLSSHLGLRTPLEARTPTTHPGPRRAHAVPQGGAAVSSEAQGDSTSPHSVSPDPFPYDMSVPEPEGPAQDPHPADAALPGHRSGRSVAATQQQRDLSSGGATPAKPPAPPTTPHRGFGHAGMAVAPSPATWAALSRVKDSVTAKALSTAAAAAAHDSQHLTLGAGLAALGAPPTLPPAVPVHSPGSRSRHSRSPGSASGSPSKSWMALTPHMSKGNEAGAGAGAASGGPTTERGRSQSLQRQQHQQQQAVAGRQGGQQGVLRMQRSAQGRDVPTPAASAVDGGRDKDRDRDRDSHAGSRPGSVASSTHSGGGGGAGSGQGSLGSAASRAPPDLSLVDRGGAVNFVIASDERGGRVHAPPVRASTVAPPSLPSHPPSMERGPGTAHRAGSERESALGDSSGRAGLGRPTTAAGSLLATGRQHQAQDQHQVRVLLSPPPSSCVFVIL